ncbi:MAG: fibronectin type III domain-containing protein [Deltaproteobacteria bacterium]|nr:fibronectin type III domain-containing protein [Deltaproteobacteria bacterium]MBW2138243.1 fibronectin type III domain-containing protein [Deltaproteobacteria bacterium]
MGERFWKAYWKTTISILLLLLAGTAWGQATRPGLIAVGDEEAIILRWVWPRGTISPPRYWIYRQTLGISQWTLITPEPITRTQDRELARKVLGDEAYRKYEPILFPELPDKEKEPEKYRAMRARMGQLWGITMLSADLYPELADLLGVRYVDRGVERGKTYIYRLSVLENGVEKVVGISLPVKTQKPNIRPPEAFEGKAGDGQVLLRWRVEKRFSGYDVFRKEGPGSELVKVNTAPIVVLESLTKDGVVRPPDWLYVDRGLQNDRTYSYIVKGRDPYGRLSLPSESIELTPRDLTPPSPPARLTAKVQDDDSVILSWQKSPDPDLAGYNVYRSLSYKMGFEKIAAGISPDTLTYRDRGLEPRRSYWYRVTAYDRSGNESGPSYTAPANLVDRTPPKAPSGLKGTAEPGKTILSWTPNNEEDLAGYRVYRSMDRDSENYKLLNQEPTPRATFTNQLPKTATDNPFYYRVTAVDTSGNESGFSNTLELQLPDVTPPRAPVFETYRVKEGTIALVWYPNTEEDLAGYDIYRSKAGKEPVTWTRLNTKTLSPKNSSFEDRSVEAGVKYAYRLRAVDKRGNASSLSTPLVASTYDKTPPPAPARLRARALAEEKAVLLTWQMPKSDDIKGVLVYRALKEAGPYYPVSPVTRDSSFRDTKVRSGRTYFYRIAAVDRSNNRSPMSKPAKIRLE